jgi:hypothetical protein
LSARDLASISGCLSSSAASCMRPELLGLITSCSCGGKLLDDEEWSFSCVTLAVNCTCGSSSERPCTDFSRPAFSASLAAASVGSCAIACA